MSLVTNFVTAETNMVQRSPDVIVKELRRIRKKKKYKPFNCVVRHKPKTLTLNDVLYGTTATDASRTLWSPSKEKHEHTMPTMICRVVYELIRTNDALKSKLLQPDGRVMNHLHKLMTKGDKRNLKKVNKNPNGLNFVERLTLYTLLQSVYIHVRMILSAFHQNLLVGEYAQTPQQIFSHMPVWVQGNEVEEQEAADAEAINQATKHGSALNRKGKVKGTGNNVVSGMPWRLHDDPMEIDEDL